jgi:hypothetical protein
MSPEIPTEPDEPRHVAHLFGDCLAGTILESVAAGPEQQWDELDSTTAEDWQMLFARAYASKRGVA